MHYVILISIILVFTQTLLFSLLGIKINNSSPFILKIAPSLYLLIAVFLHPKFKFYVTREVAFSFIAFSVFFLYSLLLNRDLYISGYINSFLLPILFYILFFSKDGYLRFSNFLIYFVIIFMLANCFEAYLERIFHFKLIKNIDDIRASDKILNALSFRSNAFFGHPLANGQITSLCISFILISYNKLRKKILYLLFFLLAMLCFNTRFSIVLSLITVSFYFLYNIFSNRKVYPRLRRKYIQVIFFILLFFTFLLFETNLGGRLMTEGLYGNDSSSLARTDVLAIFNFLSIKDILFGANDQLISFLMYRTRTDNLIIENPFIVFTLKCGIVLTFFLFYSQYLMIKRSIKSWSPFQKAIVLLPWILNISSNISIAGGAMSISYLLIFIFLYNRNEKNILI
ncbi:hypothetical protein [Phocaeicola sp.]